MGSCLPLPQVVALWNLNPPDVEAAMQLVPMLKRFKDSQVQTMLSTIARAAARMTGT